MNNRTSRAYKLMKTGSLIIFEITNTDIQTTVDNENLAVTQRWSMLRLIILLWQIY